MSKSNAVPTDTSYNNYYLHTGQDAQCLQVGDKIARDGRLLTVVDVVNDERSGEHSVRLSNGFAFDPTVDNNNLRTMDFYRPRKMFTAVPINSPRMPSKK